LRPLARKSVQLPRSCPTSRKLWPGTLGPAWLSSKIKVGRSGAGADRRSAAPPCSQKLPHGLPHGSQKLLWLAKIIIVGVRRGAAEIKNQELAGSGAAGMAVCEQLHAHPMATQKTIREMELERKKKEIQVCTNLDRNAKKVRALSHKKVLFFFFFFFFPSRASNPQLLLVQSMPTLCTEPRNLIVRSFLAPWKHTRNTTRQKKAPRPGIEPGSPA
jgi:hypothetical protein